MIVQVEVKQDIPGLTLEFWFKGDLLHPGAEIVYFGGLFYIEIDKSWYVDLHDCQGNAPGFYISDIYEPLTWMKMSFSIGRTSSDPNSWLINTNFMM